MLETLIERIPQAVLELSLLQLSLRYIRLEKIIISGIFKAFTVPMWVVFVIIISITFWGIINTIINHKYIS